MQHATDGLEAAWQTQPVGPGFFVQLLRRQLVPLLLAPVLCGALGFGYLVVATPSFSSAALLNVDVGGAQSDLLNATLVSHMEEIRSNAVTSDVIDSLGLDDGVALQVGRLDRTIGAVREGLGIDEPREMSEEEIRTAIENDVASGLDVQRVGDSTLIRVTYFTGNSQDAAEMANAYADAYVDGLVRRSINSARRRAENLRSRAEEVRQEAIESYAEIQQIRLRDGLDLNDFEDPDARAAALRETLFAIEDSEAAIATSLTLLDDADDITALEAAAFQADGGPELYYAFQEATTRLEQFRERGAAPNSLAQLEASVENLRGDLGQLLNRTRRNLHVELAILAARRENIAREFDRDQIQSNLRNWSEILIAEHRAGVFQSVYADHLRELEVVYGRSGVVPVRIMARARPSPEPSAPDAKLVLVVAMMLGLALGVTIAMLREWQRSQDSLVLAKQGPDRP